MSLERGTGSNWYVNEVGRKVDNGRSTCFWKDTWVGRIPLCDQFSRLFLISDQ